MSYAKSSDFSKVREHATRVSLDDLALSLVLPHEHKPVRFPVVPAALTSLLNVMSAGTIPIADGTATRAFLCRDPAYPLWIEKTFTSATFYIESVGSPTTWNLTARANAVMMLPVWDGVNADNAPPVVNGIAITPGAMIDNGVIGNAPGTQAIFIPPGSQFCIRLFTGVAGGGTGIEFEICYQLGGEEFVSTVVASANGGGFLFSGPAGGTTPVNGVLSEGIIPYGMCHIRQMRTTATGPTANANPILQVGWASSGIVGSPTATPVKLFAPYGPPPEFGASTVPYGRTRLNASAALFTNVSSVLNKEGTVLAGRLRPSVVDPWNFQTANLNAVHPSMRYFGPLEKGLYTFTSPTGNDAGFADAWITMPSVAPSNPSARPLFNYKDIGMYNAMIFSDLGSSSAGTQLAVSSYGHLEFESSSALFTPGVSYLTLEHLHAAEVALLQFGHFHENPTHWAIIAAAAKQALQIVGPMIAPYVRQLAEKVVEKGVELLAPKKEKKQPAQPPAPRSSRPRRQRVRVMKGQK